jgi:hypothetical protein
LEACGSVAPVGVGDAGDDGDGEADDLTALFSLVCPCASSADCAPIASEPPVELIGLAVSETAFRDVPARPRLAIASS